MDEGLRIAALDAALDRLARGEAPLPGMDDTTTELLDLAQAFQGLAEPEWPRNEQAFLARLMPPERRERRIWAWPGAAAAAVAALLLAQVPAPPSLSVAQSAAPAATHANGKRVNATFGAAAPVAPRSAAAMPASGPAVQTGSADSYGLADHGTARGAARLSPYVGAWLTGDVLALRGPAPRFGPFVTVQDLLGRKFRIAVHRSGSAQLLAFTGLSPGWYRLPSRYGGVAILLPLPAGAAAQGSLRLAARDQPTRLAGVRLLSLELGSGGIAAELQVVDPAQAQGIAVRSAKGAERPVRLAVQRTPGGYLARVVFDPVPKGTSELDFLAQGKAGGWTQIKAVHIGP